MALPTSVIWNLADFDESTLGTLLSLGPSDVDVTPSASPYFGYNADFSVLTAQSRDGVLAQLDFNTAIPSQFTVELLVRFPQIPHDVADLEDHRAGLTIADDAGRGVNLYFATTGLAVSRVDDFGSVLPLPDTTDLTAEITNQFWTVRVAVDSGLGRAYVFVGQGDTSFPTLIFIVPVEETPPTAVDLFRLFVKGTASQPVRMEIKRLRLSSTVVISNFPPTANAGPDRVTPVGQAVRFDGRASFDAEGAPLRYSWRAIDAPMGSTFAADNSSGSTTDDGDADGYTPTLVFTASALPGWVGTGDILKIAGTTHRVLTVNNPGGTLDVDTDTIPDNLTDEPFRIIRQSLLVGADTETPYAVPDIQGIYRFELRVNDGEQDSEASEVLASIVGARTPFGVEPDVRVLWDALGDEWRFIEGREVFEEAWRGAAQLFGGYLLEAWQYHYNFSIRDAQSTFQRKWVAYRSLIAESSPDTSVVSPRYGALQAAHEFESGDPTVTGLTLVVEIASADAVDAVNTVVVTLGSGTLSGIITTINAALVGTGVEAYSFAVMLDSPIYRHEAFGSTTDDGDGDRFTETFAFTPNSLPSWVATGSTLVVDGNRHTVDTVNNAGGTLTITEAGLFDNLSVQKTRFRLYRQIRLGLRSSTVGFRLTEDSTAAVTLGLNTAVYNYLRGTNGSLVTGNTYYAGDGLNLVDQGITRGDLLELNQGQSFVIDRVLTDPFDPMDGQRLLLVDALPFDASKAWAVPSVVRSTVVDYEIQGAYPGDLVKAEVFDTELQSVTDVTGTLVAQRGKQLAVDLTGFFSALQDTERYELRLIGVKRRKALPLPEGVLSVPRLQDKIPVVADPEIWMENIDYVIEPFYRDVDEAAVPMLQFRDSVFIDPDLEPPDIFWAELTVFSNAANVENNFGRLVGFLRDDAATLPQGFNYVAGVAGLLYAHQRGPRVHTMRVGAQILLGQPFAEVNGLIQEIRSDFSPTTGRMLVQDDDGFEPSRSEIVRTYYYKKDPLDLSTTSGLDTNPDTGAPWAQDDKIPQFSPIGSGVGIVDLYNDPTWFRPFVRAGLFTEIEKFFYFVVSFNLDLVTITNLSLLFQFLYRVKPTYTHPILLGLRNHVDDIDVTDEFGMSLTMHLYDSTCGAGRAYMFDDYRGDGTIWSSFDDGATFYDALTDCPVDVIEFCLQIAWPGGVITFDSIFFYDTLVTDITGAHTGTPGSTFTVTYDMTLEAGDYRVCGIIKAGNLVLPS